MSFVLVEVDIFAAPKRESVTESSPNKDANFAADATVDFDLPSLEDLAGKGEELPLSSSPNNPPENRSEAPSARMAGFAFDVAGVESARLENKSDATDFTMGLLATSLAAFAVDTIVLVSGISSNREESFESPNKADIEALRLFVDIL